MRSILKIRSTILLFIIIAALSIPGVMACCSLHPAVLTGTYGWVSEAEKDGKRVHLLYYENEAQNLTSDGSANAMILPIPAIDNSMSDKNMLEGEQFRGLAKAMYGSTMDSASSLTVPFNTIVNQLNGLNSLGHSAQPQVQVFTKGSYTVVLSNSAEAIPGALQLVPSEKRPKLNKEIFEAYGKWYPGWTFALCCFNNKERKSPEPLVWWYEPRTPSELFFPGVDAHDGRAPKMDTLVNVEHHLVASSNFSILLDKITGSARKPELIRNYSPTVKTFLPPTAISHFYSGQELQGDFVFNTMDVRCGLFRPFRKQPPGIGNDNNTWYWVGMRDTILAIRLSITAVLAGITLLFRKSWLTAAVLLAVPFLFPLIGFPLLNFGQAVSIAALRSTTMNEFLLLSAFVLLPPIAGPKGIGIRRLYAGLFALLLLAIYIFCAGDHLKVFWIFLYSGLLFWSHARPSAKLERSSQEVD